MLSLHLHSRVRLSTMLFFETAFLLLYSCKQHVLLWHQQIFRTSNLVCSKQQSVLITSYKQLELVNYKLKISSLSTLMLIEQYIFLLSHSKIYSAISAAHSHKEGQRVVWAEKIQDMCKTTEDHFENLKTINLSKYLNFISLPSPWVGASTQYPQHTLTRKGEGKTGTGKNST